MIRSVRGMHDLLETDTHHHDWITSTIKETARLYGYRPIQTPMVEPSMLFTHMLGLSSDVVGKEMYSFTDQGGKNLSLRPEGTASVVRAFVGGPPPPLPWKVIYHGPMFRRERPQKGRLRQFHQVGVEMIGITDPYADAEIIQMAASALDTLSIKTRLHLNTLGAPDSRHAWRQALVNYLTPLVSELSEDSQRRLTTNPLRILDSKDPQDQEIAAKAPKIHAYLSDEDHRFFTQLRHCLEDCGVEYTEDPALVRGLDYYGNTAFEFKSEELGAQSTVLAGGRYDGMVKSLGGQDLGAIGWAAGIERLALVSQPPPAQPIDIMIFSEGRVTMGEEHHKKPGETNDLADKLRENGLSTIVSFSGNRAKNLKKAARQGIRWMVVKGHENTTKAAGDLIETPGAGDGNRPPDIILYDLYEGSELDFKNNEGLLEQILKIKKKII